MKTKEISRSEWPIFFDSFTRQHEGGRVTLEVFGADIGDQIEGRELEFEGITAELSETGDRIEIMIGAKPAEHVTHSIAAPTQVSLEQTDEGADASLLIKSSDGTSALLSFGGGSFTGNASAVR